MSRAAAEEQLLDVLRRQRVIGIIRAADPASAAVHLDVLLSAGLAAVEVSLSTPGALEVIAEAVSVTHRDLIEDAGVQIGVGTVLTERQLHASVDAGARFVVTPTTDPAVIGAAIERGVAIVPGAATPSEVQVAVAGGASAVKLFPASLWSISAFRDLRGVFGDVPFVPTGGIREVDAPAWIAAGAVAVGMGSALTSGAVDLPALLRALEAAAS